MKIKELKKLLEKFDENTKVRLNITYKRETLLYSPLYIGDRYSPTYKYIEVQS